MFKSESSVLLLVFFIVALCVCACSSSDPGVPVYEGDDDYELSEEELAGEADGDFEFVELPASRCKEGVTHANDIAVFKEEGAVVAYCVAEDSIDGTVWEIPADTLSVDAKLLISMADDFEIADGETHAGPSIELSAVAVGPGAEPALMAATPLTAPLFAGTLSQELPVDLKVYYELSDGQKGSLDFEDGSPLEDGGVEFIIGAGNDYVENGKLDLFQMSVSRFGKFQVVVPIQDQGGSK